MSFDAFFVDFEERKITENAIGLRRCGKSRDKKIPDRFRSPTRGEY